MSAKRARWTATSVAESVASVTPEEITLAAGSGDDEQLYPYLDAAAVLSAFEPASLRPAGETGLDGRDAIAGLLDHSTAFIGDDGAPRWILRAEVRREALERLGSRAPMRRALESNPQRTRGPVQQTLEAAIDGNLAPIADNSPAALTHILQVSTWLGGLLDGVPDPETIHRELARVTLLEPFRVLVGDHFGGRRKELSKLRAYVDVLTTDSTREALGRAVRSGRDRPPLLIHGLGGVGKSTLVAKFILDHVGPGGVSDLPFAYVDFDRAGVIVEEPVTILLEAARQLATEREWGSDRWEELRLRSIEELAALGRKRIPRQRGARRPRAFAGASLRSPFVSEFATALAETTSPERTFLLVLDTFEEVQYRSGEFVSELGLFLQELQDRIPQLRTVIAGRVPIEEFETEELKLGALDDDAALGFLRAKGISDEGAAKLIVSRFDGNPLTLDLAARVVQRDPDELETIRTMRTKRRGPLFFLSIDAEEVQGYLYRRILDHIHDDEIKRLAHPGLVLRRITPELILKVLAEPCGVDAVELHDARRLFEGLRREITLVKPGGEDVLEHRPDVRRLMLPLFEKDEPQVVEKIHRAAVAYYESREGVVARAEEIYHRLFVDELRDAAEDRWMDGVEEHLRGALEEFPAEGQVFLSPRVRREPSDPSVWERADTRARERRLERRIENLLDLARPSEALELLDSTKTKTPGSRLHLLEAMAHRENRDLNAARLSIDAGLGAAASPGSGPTVLDLLELAAQIEEEAGNVDVAREHIATAYRAAKRLRDPARVLALGAAWLDVCNRDETGGPAPDTMLEELLADFLDFPARALEADPTVTRSVAGDLGERYPAAVMRAFRTVGLPGVTEADLQPSGGAAHVAARLRARARPKHGVW